MKQTKTIYSEGRACLYVEDDDDHKHTPIDDEGVERAFLYPVARGDGYNPEAHGSICTHYECACGATKSVNSNGGHVEEGPWCEPAS